MTILVDQDDDDDEEEDEDERDDAKKKKAPKIAQKLSDLGMSIPYYYYHYYNCNLYIKY